MHCPKSCVNVAALTVSYCAELTLLLEMTQCPMVRWCEEMDAVM